MLSDLQLLDGQTADPATGNEWLQCLKSATSGKIKNITVDEALVATELLLKKYADQIQTNDFNIVLQDIQEREACTEARQLWLNAIDKAISNNFPLDVSKFSSS